MAIVKFGSTVIGVRGNLGGVVYTNGPSGPFVKPWRNPVKSQTTRAAAARRNLSPYGAAWSAMTSSDQDDWRTYALSPGELDYNSLGLQYWLTGYQWFVRANVRRAALGLALTETVPSASAVDPSAGTSLTATAGPPLNVDFTWTAGDVPAGHGALLYAAVHPTVGLATIPSTTALIWQPYEPAGTTTDISTAMAARFGTLQAGYSIFTAFRIVRADGVASAAANALVRIT